MVERESVITCPECGAEAEEELHEGRHAMYECLVCGAVLRPRRGEHCVFCSYGSARCLEAQREREAAVAGRVR